MKKQNILLMGLWALVFTGFIAISKLHSAQSAEGDDGPIAARTIVSDGDHRTPHQILVGSMSAVSPYTLIPSTASTETLDPKRIDRGMVIKNPSASFELMIGTWSGFTVTDQWFGVPVSSGIYGDACHERFWMMYPPGASSQTVQIMHLTSGESSQ